MSLLASAKRKTIRLITLGFVVCASLLGQTSPKTKYFKLENGLRVYLYERHTLPLVNMVIGVDLGSKDESEETSGLVHMLEHYILFRGTEARTGAEISQDIRRHGAYFNAHTGQDFALFELSLPSQHLDFGLKNQREVLFNLKLTKEALDEEKQVILEEISQVKDDPLRYGTSIIYQNLFQGHPYTKPVYGKKEIIEGVTAEQMEEFYRSFFVPSNCAMAIVGDFETEKLEEKVRSIFGDLKAESFTPPKFEKVPPLEKTIEIEEEMDINMGYLVIGMSGPDYKHVDQYALDVLTEVIGTGINPMLYRHLQGARIHPNRIFMEYSSLKYGGAILIFITLDPKRTDMAKRETIRFLKEAREINYAKDDYLGEEQFYALDYLESAKNQIKFKANQAQEKGLDMATSLVIFMLMNSDEARGSYLGNIEKVTSSNLRKAAGDYLAKGKYVIVSLIPKKKN